jgi:phospholipase C
MMRTALLATTICVAAGAALLPARAAAQAAIVMQPPASPEIAHYAIDPAHDPAPAPAQLTALLRHKVKYLFVLFQENRSFDSYYGSFPGVDGLFSQPPEQTPGYTQPIRNVDGSTGTIQPFRIGTAEHAADTDDVDHGFARMVAKMNITNGVGAMDRFAVVEEMKYTPAGANPPLKAKQYGELTMAYSDCDTIPFMWNFANRFAIYDHIFQTTIGPSTPNAIAMIAGQTGETQWVRHPETASNLPANASVGGEPIFNDNDPFWGSPQDKTSGTPVNPNDYPSYHTALNQTYATVMLTLPGRSLYDMTKQDRNPMGDLVDVRDDIQEITSIHHAAMPWLWYEEGYDREPNDATSAGAGGSHLGYIAHHNGPQYFGYVANNPAMAKDMKGLGDFFADMKAHRLPARGGVFYVRGGYRDITGLKPAFQDPGVQKNFQGDDDHPGYSDSELSDAMVARSVNAIAASPYWQDSAIIITYDESEGDYDHVPPHIIDNNPAGQPMRRGPRIPLILISPFARAHVVAHETGDHNSVIKLINTLFDLPALADLPDEKSARETGMTKFGQKDLGPEDDFVADVGNLSSAFDPQRLEGRAAPLPASYAETPAKELASLPHYGGQGCKAIGMTPVDIARGIHNPIPADFNPRPSTDPSP